MRKTAWLHNGGCDLRRGAILCQRKERGLKKGTTPTGRQLFVKVKTRAKRSNSSAEWLLRQLNDPYVAEAKKLGYRSRSAFKLLQLDEKFHILKSGLKVIDLGAAPGGWLQVTVPCIKSKEGKGVLVGIDLLPIDTLEGAIILQGDILADETEKRLKEALGGPADLVLSDMAAATTGHSRTDQIRTMALAEAALDFAITVLAPGGGFVVKLFQGGAERELLIKARQHFATVRHAKPAASRAESSELYLVAQGFKSGKS